MNNEKNPEKEIEAFMADAVVKILKAQPMVFDLNRHDNIFYFQTCLKDRSQEIDYQVELLPQGLCVTGSLRWFPNVGVEDVPEVLDVLNRRNKELKDAAYYLDMEDGVIRCRSGCSGDWLLGWRFKSCLDRIREILETDGSWLDDTLYRLVQETHSIVAGHPGQGRKKILDFWLRAQEHRKQDDDGKDQLR